MVSKNIMPPFRTQAQLPLRGNHTSFTVSISKIVGLHTDLLMMDVIRHTLRISALCVKKMITLFPMTENPMAF